MAIKVRRAPTVPISSGQSRSEVNFPSDFFGSEILAKSDFFWSMKDAGIFMGREKKQRDFFGLRKRDYGILGGMLRKCM